MVLPAATVPSVAPACANAVRSRHPEFGRCADHAVFWRNVIDVLSLAQTMALLDRDLVVP